MVKLCVSGTVVEDDKHRNVATSPTLTSSGDTEMYASGLPWKYESITSLLKKMVSFYYIDKYE